MKKRYVIPVVLSSTLLAGSFTSNLLAVEKSNVISSNVQAQKVWNENANVPLFVKVKFAEKQSAGTSDRAVQVLEKYDKKLGIKDPKQNFKKKSVQKDDLGMTHVRLQQVKNGVPVVGSEVIVHYNKENQPFLVNGSHNKEVEGESIDTNPSISSEQALDTAKAKVEAPKELPYEPTTELVIYPFEGKNNLAYKVNVNFLGEEPGNWIVFVDAKTGEVIDYYNKIMDAFEEKSQIGAGTGVLGDKRQLHVTKKKADQGVVFELADESHEGLDGIYTYDAGNSWSFRGLPGNLFEDKDASWKDEYQRAAVDAHYNSEEVYEYFLNEHDRNSIDGEGGAIISSVHFGENYANAFWNGEQMTYGDGDGEFFIPLSAGLDVAAHEMTHGVTTHTAGLQYRFQSGAINEAFSDIFGALIDEGDWEIGEDIMAEGAIESGRTSLRSLSNPSKYSVGSTYAPYGNGEGKYPSHMDEYYDLPLHLDNGGVHINSSIINHAAYLTGVQIGKDKLGKIYYRALTTYLTPTSNFVDARKAVVQSAIDIYGEGSAEAIAAADGYDGVGIDVE